MRSSCSRARPPGQRAHLDVEEIHSTAEALSKKLDANKYAGEPQGTDGNRTFSIAHREGSGLAEIHDTVADILVISEGQITFVYGGTIVDGKTTAPGRDPRLRHHRRHRGRSSAPATSCTSRPRSRTS